MASQYYSRSRPPSDMGLKAESLMSRYPDITARELDTLIEIFPRLPILDAGMMAADDRLSANVAAFHKAHGAKLVSPKATLIGFTFAFLVLPVATTIALLWWILGPSA